MNPAAPRSCAAQGADVCMYPDPDSAACMHACCVRAAGDASAHRMGMAAGMSSARATMVGISADNVCGGFYYIQRRVMCRDQTIRNQRVRLSSFRLSAAARAGLPNTASRATAKKQRARPLLSGYNVRGPYLLICPPVRPYSCPPGGPSISVGINMRPDCRLSSPTVAGQSMWNVHPPLRPS